MTLTSVLVYNTEELELQEELVSLMPMVYEANSISEELNKQVHCIP